MLRPLIFLKFLPEYSENQKWAAPLIRLLLQTPSPRGEGYIIRKSKIYCTPHQSALPTASPQGEGSERGSYFNFRQFATVRYETPCGCVMKRAMPAPEGKP